MEKIDSTTPTPRPASQELAYLKASLARVSKLQKYRAHLNEQDLSFVQEKNGVITVNENHIAKAKRIETSSRMLLQLRRATTQESGFNWEHKLRQPYIKKIVVNEVVVHDRVDLMHFRWFLRHASKQVLHFSTLRFAPGIHDDLLFILSESSTCKVAKGSRIDLYEDNESPKSSFYTKIKPNLEKFGFQVCRVASNKSIYKTHLSWEPVPSQIE